MANNKYDFDSLVKELVEILGGHENIIEAFHCATRFRVILIDENKVDKKRLEKISLVKGFVFSGGQYQIIFGAGTVNKVYDQYIKTFGSDNNFIRTSNSTNISSTITKQKVWDDRLSFKSNFFNSLRWGVRQFGDIFIPLIPIFIAGGLSLAMTSLMGVIFDVENNNAAADFQKIFQIIGDAAFSFLPIYVGYTAMKKFGGNPALGLIVGAILVSPILMNSYASFETLIKIETSLNQSLVDAVIQDGYMKMNLDSIDPNIYNVFVLNPFNNNMFELVATYNIIDGTIIIQDDLSSSLNIYLEGAETLDEIAAFAAGINQGVLDQKILDGWIQNDILVIDEVFRMTGTINVLFKDFAGGFFSLKLVGYQAQVFSSLLTIGLAYYIEKFMIKFSPEPIAIISVPFVTVFATTFFALWLIGTFGVLISKWIGLGLTQIYTSLNYPGFGLGGAIVSIFNPFLVMTGLHQGLVAVETTMMAETASRYGESFTWITAQVSMANVAMGAAVLAFVFVTLKHLQKGNSLSSGVTASLGIIEPAIFGTALIYVFPLVGACIGGAIGGYWTGMTNTVATTLGSASWLGLVQFNPVPTEAYINYLADMGKVPFITQNIGNMASATIGMTLSFISAFVATILLSFTSWGQKIGEKVGDGEKTIHSHKTFFSYKIRKEINRKHKEEIKLEKQKKMDLEKEIIENKEKLEDEKINNKTD